MKIVKWSMALVLAALTVAAVAVLAWRWLHQQAVAVSFLSVTNDFSGNEIAFFCFSNRTPKAVDYLSDGSARPYYSLFQVLPADPITGLRICTNYNQERFAHVKQLTLAPHASVNFPVHIPAGVTGAVLTLNFMRPKMLFEDSINEIKQGYGKAPPSAETYENIQLFQPFR